MSLPFMTYEDAEYYILQIDGIMNRFSPEEFGKLVTLMRESDPVYKGGNIIGCNGVEYELLAIKPKWSDNQNIPAKIQTINFEEDTITLKVEKEQMIKGFTKRPIFLDLRINRGELKDG
jgi:hypothetical protein